MKAIAQHFSLLVALGGLFIFAGNQTLVAQEKDGDKTKPNSKAVCKPHKITKEDCFICDPKLRQKGRLWCKEHERYEDRCWVCHPEAQDKKHLYCKEHSLYEDECFICHPEFKKEPDKAK